MAPAVVDKTEIAIGIVEILGDGAVGPGIYFGLEMFYLGVW